VGNMGQMCDGVAAFPVLCYSRTQTPGFGDQKEADNVFRWDKVILNQPGNDGYKPWMPWVYKAKGDGTIAADVHDYVDDL
jgi:hypothetical protein